MSENLVKHVFSILGTLLVGIILFIIIFGTAGQQLMWTAIEPAVIEQWQNSTFDNGTEITLTYEDNFEELELVAYNEAPY